MAEKLNDLDVNTVLQLRIVDYRSLEKPGISFALFVNDQPLPFTLELLQALKKRSFKGCTIVFHEHSIAHDCSQWLASEVAADGIDLLGDLAHYVPPVLSIASYQQCSVRFSRVVLLTALLDTHSDTIRKLEWYLTATGSDGAGGEEDERKALWEEWMEALGGVEGLKTVCFHCDDTADSTNYDAVIGQLMAAAEATATTHFHVIGQLFRICSRADRKLTVLMVRDWTALTPSMDRAWLAFCTGGDEEDEGAKWKHNIYLCCVNLAVGVDRLTALLPPDGHKVLTPNDDQKRVFELKNGNSVTLHTSAFVPSAPCATFT